MTGYRIIQLPNAPAIEGLQFRFFHDEHDFEGLVQVIEACQIHDKVDPLSPDAGIPTVDELRDSFQTAENMTLETDLLIVTLHDTVIGFQWVRWWDQENGPFIYYHRGRVVPEWRAHGIGTATLLWAEQRAYELALTHNTLGNAILRANTTQYEGPYNELLANKGYMPVHSFIEMGYDESLGMLPEPAMPEGFTLRPVTKEHYRAVWTANEEAFVDEYEHRASDNSAYARFLTKLISTPGYDPALWQVAWQGDEIAGVALCEITERNVAEITDLSVRPAYRDQGLGLALLVQMVHTLREAGYEHIRLFTDTDDVFGARKLYEGVGFRLLTQYIRYQKALEQPTSA
jgi:mycothiol synthase